MKKPSKQLRKKRIKGWAVYSKWGFHAAFNLKHAALWAYPNDKKASIFYRYEPCEIIIKKL